MQTTDRPDFIDQMLQTIRPLIDSESYIEFEVYLNNLEKKQDLYNTESESAGKWDPDNPPIWSHQRQMERAQKRHARMLQKLTMNQK